MKFQDEIYGGKQKWTHIEIHEMAVEEFGFYTRLICLGKHTET